MAKALGTTAEEEHKLGLHKLAKVCPVIFAAAVLAANPDHVLS